MLDGLIYRPTRRSKASADRYRSASVDNSQWHPLRLSLQIDVHVQSRTAELQEEVSLLSSSNRSVTAPIAPFAAKGQPTATARG